MLHWESSAVTAWLGGRGIKSKAVSEFLKYSCEVLICKTVGKDREKAGCDVRMVIDLTTSMCCKA